MRREASNKGRDGKDDGWDVEGKGTQHVGLCVHTKRRANETPSYYYYYFIQSGYPHVGVRQGQIDVERE